MQCPSVFLRRGGRNVRRYGIYAYFCLFLLTVALHCYAAESFDVRTLASRSIPAVATIETRDKRGNAIGIGSGFLISPDGILVSNLHVIAGAHELTAYFENGASMSAKMVIGYDCNSDLVVLQLETKSQSLPFLRLARTENIQVGEPVIAIGSPGGLSATVSEGIISAIRRETDTGVRFLQTTAAISPGSSGGPLIGRGTEVVGVTSLLFEGGQNLNFAVPSEYIISVLRNPSPRELRTAGTKCSTPRHTTQASPQQPGLDEEAVFESVAESLAAAIKFYCGANADTSKEFYGCVGREDARVRGLLTYLDEKSKTYNDAAHLLLNCNNSWSRNGATWNFRYFEHCIQLEVMRYGQRGYKVK